MSPHLPHPSSFVSGLFECLAQEIPSVGTAHFRSRAKGFLLVAGVYHLDKHRSFGWVLSNFDEIH